MPLNRPTFHEAWYRVADLHPKLLSSVQVYRQHFRGQMWYVLEDPATNKYSRLSASAYHFIGLLDGRRKVRDAWGICNEKLQDDAPTQGEVIQLLGRLYCSNLLWADLPADTESLFLRYRKRVKREVQGYLTNLLFVRIPLFDPDSFLERWVKVFGALFSWFGFVLWAVLIAAGLYFLLGNWGRFINQSYGILSTDNLLYLYLSLILVKTLHEFSHAFACKKFGRLNHNGGQVHTMGIMLLVFVPVPYTDASSSWAFRNKRHRAVVGAAGIIAELAAAAVAAIIWANSSEGTAHTIAYNMMFIAGVSTLVFNGNPLLRFDGYYILSDLIEIANLGHRSRAYLYYLVKRCAWGAKKALNPAHTGGEKAWFVFYGIASILYRVFICVRILLFLNERLPSQLFILVPALAGAAIVVWVFVPFGKFLHYLATNPELEKTRTRGWATTAVTATIILASITAIQLPDHCRVEGVVEPVKLAVIHAETDGFLKSYLPSNNEVKKRKELLIELRNPSLEVQKRQLMADKEVLQFRLMLAQTRETAEAQIIQEKLDALDQKIQRVNEELDGLKVTSPLDGVWVWPGVELSEGMYLARGQKIGFVADLDDLMVRATAGQNTGAQIFEEAYEQVELRVRGRADLQLRGKITKKLPAGRRVLPSAALGYAAGGTMPTISRDPNELKSAERFFEIHISPDKQSHVKLVTGQRVIVRFKMPPKPLALQWWRTLRQVFQRRFRI